MHWVVVYCWIMQYLSFWRCHSSWFPWSCTSEICVWEQNPSDNESNGFGSRSARGSVLFDKESSGNPQTSGKKQVLQNCLMWDRMILVHKRSHASKPGCLISDTFLASFPSWIIHLWFDNSIFCNFWTSWPFFIEFLYSLIHTGLLQFCILHIYVCMTKTHLNLLLLQFKVSFSLIPE